MSLSAELTAGLCELESDLATTFRWKGIKFNGSLDLPCIVSTLRRGLMLMHGGFEVGPEVQLTLIVRKEVLPPIVTADNTIITVDSTLPDTSNSTAPPRTGNRLIHRNITYRVSVVRDAAAGSHWELDLTDIAR